MKILYLDLNMGAAGDMLAAALLELLPEGERKDFTKRLSSIGIKNVDFSIEKASRGGIAGTHFNVSINGEDEAHFHGHRDGAPLHAVHHHTSLHDIEYIVSHLGVSDKVKADVLNVYKIIADAESLAHGCAVEEIHFHEVGMMDAVADITTVCMLIETLSPDKILSSPIHVGAGTVKCAHGIMPVPAPATANILKGVPIYSKDIMTELCTPTGAALVKYFSSCFQSLPEMSIDTIGYGLGTKDFENHPNCLRAIIGESIEKPADECILLSCNVDDMTGEDIGFAIKHLMQSGARDVYVENVVGKKSRPVNIINVIVDSDKKETIVSEIFKHTPTLGIREIPLTRYVLDREIITVDTPFGPVRKKVSSGYGVNKSKWEFDDIEKIAEENRLSITEVKERLRQKGLPFR